MKSIITVLFLIITAIGATGQNNNEKRLSEIDAEISAAKTNENYGYADTLSQEKTLRLEIREAVNNDDFEKAQELQLEIDSLYPKKAKSNIFEKETELTNNETSVQSLWENHLKIPSSKRSGPYVEGICSFGLFRRHIASPSFGIALGMIKYFYNENKRQIFGLNARSSFSVYFMAEKVVFDPILIGPHVAVPLRKNATFEYGMLTGLTIDDSDPTFNVGTVVNMRFSNFSIGLNSFYNPTVKDDYTYNYTQKITDSFRIELDFGFKF